MIVNIEVGDIVTIQYKNHVVATLNIESEKPPHENDKNLIITPGNMHPDNQKREYYIIVKGQK